VWGGKKENVGYQGFTKAGPPTQPLDPAPTYVPWELCLLNQVEIEIQKHLTPLLILLPPFLYHPPLILIEIFSNTKFS
jgi:hypothetical protein